MIHVHSFYNITILHHFKDFFLVLWELSGAGRVHQVLPLRPAVGLLGLFSNPSVANLFLEVLSFFCLIFLYLTWETLKVADLWKVYPDYIV